jgi:hypothetical protein
MLSRLTGLDMSQFLSWHTANLMAYEEIMSEMSSIENPITSSPPIVQLATLVTFNTLLFVGTVLIQKTFHVDVLPYVCTMAGVNPVSGSPSNTAAAAAAGVHPTTASGARTPPTNPPTPPATTSSGPRGGGMPSSLSSAFAAFTQNFGSSAGATR